jgi:hypothetical protein
MREPGCRRRSIAVRTPNSPGTSGRWSGRSLLRASTPSCPAPSTRRGTCSRRQMIPASPRSAPIGKATGKSRGAYGSPDVCLCKTAFLTYPTESLVAMFESMGDGTRRHAVENVFIRALNCPNPWSRSVDIPVLAMFAPSLPDMANLLVIHEAYGVLSADTSGSRAYHRPDLTHPIAGRCDARMPRPRVRCCSCSLHEGGSTGLRDRATTMSLGRRGAALSRAERSDT